MLNPAPTTVLVYGYRRKALSTAIADHAALGLSYVTSGHYEGEHWLATFAVYHLTGSGLEVPFE